MNFQIQFQDNLVSQLPPVISTPAHQTLAASADAADTISGLENGVIDRVAQLTPNVPFAQTQSRQTLRNAVPRAAEKHVHPSS